jgi:uncharacterized protein YbcI
MQLVHEPLDTLAQDFLQAWQKAHGFPAAHACPLIGPKHVAILMEGVFSRAERKLAEDQNGEMLLRKYTIELLGIIGDQMTDRVEKVTGQGVRGQNMSFDTATDQVVYIFRLDDHLLPTHADKPQRS